MKYGYEIGGKEYSFETKKQGKGFDCQCIELPQAKVNGSTEKAAIEACINAASQLLGKSRIKVVKKVKKRWVSKAEAASMKKKPWWCFW